MQEIAVKVTSIVKTMRFFLHFYGISKKKTQFLTKSQKSRILYVQGKRYITFMPINNFRKSYHQKYVVNSCIFITRFFYFEQKID